MGNGPSGAGTKSIPVWVMVFSLIAVALVAGAAAYYVSSRASQEESAAEVTVAEGAGTEAETAAETGAAAADATAGESADSADKPLPSFVRFAYVRAVTGAPGAWEASLDLFDIFTGAEAESYAASHGMTVPGNGILYVNESETPEPFPLSDAAVITYTTGGVEALETHTATIQQLRDYAAGSSTAMPDAFRDQWKVTVESGVVTRVEMIAVAD